LLWLAGLLLLLAELLFAAAEVATTACLADAIANAAGASVASVRAATAAYLAAGAAVTDRIAADVTATGEGRVLTRKSSFLYAMLAFLLCLCCSCFARWLSTCSKVVSTSTGAKS
jgi:hypothetical protein